MTDDTARADVSAAQSLLRPSAGTMTSLGPGVRARAAALLLRRALERGLDDFWQGVAPGMTRVGKHRILCLGAYTDRETARRCYLTWSALSTACHYRAHDMPPAPSEIQSRLPAVEALLEALERGPTVPSAATLPPSRPQEAGRSAAATPAPPPAPGRQPSRTVPKPGPPPGRRAAPPVVGGP
ncbi:hypothetical protein [Streptomyces sp. ADI98-10]|uniref:hypothetical protein n=1 Tax=Streptomyces sp. ADI98-10 TaxID=1522763 RepID=UPI000F55560A|nr:hypothetical protein [Streptomyces sp. ADI98-10]RPK93891.1 hypothetical protein EES46_04350 [Streptomyces sp. ADI98-10]